LSCKALLRLSLGIVVGVGIVRAAASLRPEWSVAVEVLTIFRCDALAYGAIAAILMHTLRENAQVARVRRAATLALPAVFFLGAVALALFGKGFLAIPHTLIPLACAAALLILVTGPRLGLLSRMMKLPILRWFGRYSYAMYVVQLPLMTMLPLTLSASIAVAGDSPVLTGLAYVFGMLGLTSAIAWVSYHTLEKHFLRLKKYF
jgi:peptidoglycan/LPS O-acetylase OafA/YrhL